MKKVLYYIFLLFIISCEDKQKTSNNNIYNITTGEHIYNCETKQIEFIKQHFGDDALNKSPKELFKLILEEDKDFFENMPNCTK